VSLFALPSPLDRPTRQTSGRLRIESPAAQLAGAPLVAIRDPGLLEAVRRIADTAGVDLQVTDADGLAAHWPEPGLVLVDVPLAELVRARGLARRAGVVVLTLDEDDPAPWRVAVELGADHVAVLPEAEPWLVDRLSDGDSAPRAPVVGVIGGCGGAGASTVAAGLAVAAARAGHRPLLVDLDPIGSGLDVLLGGDDVVGARWEDLSDARGRVDGAALRSVLPTPASVPLITWRRDRTPGSMPNRAVIGAVVDAGRRASDLVVVDLPRRLPIEAEVVGRLAQVVVVTPARVRAAVAAGRLTAGLGLTEPQLWLVVRGPAPSGLDGDDVAAAVGATQWVWLDAEARRDEHEEHGVPPAASARGPLAACCQSLIDRFIGSDRAA